MPLLSYAQIDTIHTFKEVIACTISEINEQNVKFTYPNESLTNSISINRLKKIVFASGRIQEFNNTSLREVNSVEDWENVTITQLEPEIVGLYKLCDTYSKARGTTTISNVAAVKERAYKKLKIEAALMGANVLNIYDAHTTDNKFGSEFESSQTTSTILSGIAYSNDIPNIDDFKNRLGNKKKFQVKKKVSMSKRSSDYSIYN